MITGSVDTAKILVYVNINYDKFKVLNFFSPMN